MKRTDNNGRSVVEVIIAVFILTVVVVGGFFAIRYITKRSESGAANGEKGVQAQVTAIAEQVENLVKSADVDILFDFEKSSFAAVNSRGFAIMTLNYGNLYIDEVSFDNPNKMTDDEKVQKAKEMLGTKGTQIAENVQVFDVDLSDIKFGNVNISCRIQKGDENVNKSKSVTVDDYVYKRVNGIAFEREPITTPTVAPTKAPEPTKEPELKEAPEPTKEPEPTDVPDPTETPEPTKEPDPTEAPEPTKAPEPEKPETQKLEQHFTLDALKNAGEEDVITVTVLCEEDTAKVGWCVGGICIGCDEVSENKALQYCIGKAPTPGKNYKVTFRIADIISEANAAGTDEISVDFYNGFKIESIER